MRRGTDVTLTMTVPGENLSTSGTGRALYFTIKQGKRQLTLGGYAAYGEGILHERVTGEYDGTKTTLTATLTQEETLYFGCESVSTQLRWETVSGAFKATNIQKLDVLPILLDKQLPRTAT